MKLGIFPLLLAVMVISIVGLHNAYSISDSIPGPNTIETYCSSGVCLTPHTYPQPNATQGFYPVGVAPGGSLLSASHLIGIQLSDSCLKLVKINATTNCPTYDKLRVFDNTNPLYDGVWVSKPYYHRLNPRVGNQYNIFTSHFVVMVDPDADYTTHARMIIIQPDSFTYINPNDIITNHTRTEYHDRFVTSCESANVAPSLSLINDTVQYFENGCTNTSFNSTSKIKMKVTPFDYNNPFSSLHYLDYLKSIYHTGFTGVNQTGGSGLKDCIHHKCKYVDPFANPNW